MTSKRSLIAPLIIGVLLAAIAISSIQGCSQAKEFITPLATAQSVIGGQVKTDNLLNKYHHLLTKDERILVRTSYDAIRELKEVSANTLDNYQTAKAEYIKVIPLYHKYKNQIEPQDQVEIVATHNKLKSVSEAIDKAIGRNIKGKRIEEYIKIAKVIMGAFAK